VVDPRKTPSAPEMGFRPSLVLKLYGGGSDRNQRQQVASSGGCVEAKQLCVERMAVRLKL
jgi:hypothetical protein